MVRAFIAIELPVFIQEAIEHYIQDLSKSEFPSEIIRWIPVKNIHLTLHFSGDIHEDRIDAIQRVLKQAAEGTAVFELTIQGLGCFPRPQKPRVIWLGVEEQREQLKHFHNTLETFLSGENFKTEARRFHPHLTLARVKKSAKLDQISTLAHQLDLIKQPQIGVFHAEAVHLIRSELHPQGAIYSHLASALLSESP